MNFLTLENVSLRYGEKLLFDALQLYINKGDKVALIARNGTGKSTLLRVVGGEIKPDGDSYKTYLRPDIRIGYLPQEPHLHPGNTVLQEVFLSDDPAIQAIYRYEQAMNRHDESAIAEAAQVVERLRAWDAQTRAEEVLHKLNITDFDRVVGTLSGGQAKRLALAKLLVASPDFLILDEPTNHLDITMIEYLEQYLLHPQLTLFMVTHDRYFLENVCDQIVELENGKLYPYPGNYSTYLERKSLRKEMESTTLSKTRKLVSHELEWIRRMPKARTTKNKARIDRFAELQESARVKLTQDAMQIDMEPERLGSKIVEAQYVTKSLGNKLLVKDFAYNFKKGERVGIVGPNGAGKTTFLKLLAGDLKPDAGRWVIGETVKIGFYRQDGLSLKEDKRVIDVVRDIAEYLPLKKGMKLSAEQLLEHFMFPRSQQQVFASQLSGGEKRRLHLLQVLMSNPNFLILDEPTNDLDILTLNVLENYLSEFPGCLVVVTHDRYFLDKLVDHLFVFRGDGTVIDFNGTYSEFRAEQSQVLAPLPDPNTEKTVSQQAQRFQDTKEKKKQLKKVERSLEQLQQERQKILDWFAEGHTDIDESTRKNNRLQQLEAEVTQLEEEWLELASELEESSD